MVPARGGAPCGSQGRLRGLSQHILWAVWATELASKICVVLSHQVYDHLSQQPQDTCADALRCLGKRSSG